jgi:hypothetical protein
LHRAVFPEHSKFVARIVSETVISECSSRDILYEYIRLVTWKGCFR